MVETEKARRWARRLASLEASGLSRRAWCEREGVNRNTLDYWCRRLLGARTAKASELAPIVVVPARAAGGVAERDRRVSIELPHGVCVHFEVGVDAVWLSALVRGIAGC